MRILRVAQTVYPESKGGGAYHVHAMSRDQASMGHDVTVLTVGDGPSRERRDGYTVVRKPVRFEPLGNEISPGVASFLSQLEPFDVVHAHSHLYFSTNLAALLCRYNETPLAITNHGLYSQTVSKRVFGAYLRTLGRWTFNQADVVFTYTPAERNALRSLGVESDVSVVSNGIDTDRFEPNGSESARINPDEKSVLFVGRLVEGKRPTDAVRVIANVRDAGIDATLYVAGTGPLESELRAVAAEGGVRESVRFLGHVPYEDMPSLYRTADVLLLPSRSEGMPRTVLEAIASGTPVVSSDLQQIKRLVTNCGSTVPVGNVESFKEAIVEHLSNPNGTHQGSEQSTDTILADHTWETTVEETTRTLQSITRDRKTPIERFR